SIVLQCVIRTDSAENFESPLRHHKKVNGLAEQSAGPFCFFRHRLLRLCTLAKAHGGTDAGQ
ncbi:hypothetical protein, partial [Bilophila wadsworthia]|uniref:hypothetical protein n=1 Tax=Bilophila wadsworthia TaxID=35833 RepID=UPI003AF0C495